ncbi:hypothetical protein J6590_047708 [Homalodisca vitripennis]|nr:hypothetical protein J6590_047708 [Homalodisca vitripennis]
MKNKKTHSNTLTHGLVTDHNKQHHPSPPQAPSPQQQAPNPRPEACTVLNTSNIIRESFPKATSLNIAYEQASPVLMNQHNGVSMITTRRNVMKESKHRNLL